MPSPFPSTTCHLQQSLWKIPQRANAITVLQNGSTREISHSLTLLRHGCPIVWQNLEKKMDLRLVGDMQEAIYHLWSSHTTCGSCECLLALQLIDKNIYNNLLQRRMMEEGACKTKDHVNQFIYGSLLKSLSAAIFPHFDLLEKSLFF